MDSAVKQRKDEWIEIPALWGDDQKPSEPLRFYPGASSSRVTIRTGSGDHGREVAISHVRAALTKVEEENG